MKNLAVLLASALSFLTCVFPARAETAATVGGTAGSETKVRKGEQFELALEGKGWHLSEYDSGVLGFVSRKTEDGKTGEERTPGQGRTVFVFYPFREGSGRLFFTRHGDEISVRVSVEGEGGTDVSGTAGKTVEAGGAGAIREIEAILEEAAAGPETGSAVAEGEDSAVGPAEAGEKAENSGKTPEVEGGAPALEAEAPLPPPLPALDLEPIPPAVPKAEPRVKEPSVPLAEPAPVPGEAPKAVSQKKPPARTPPAGTSGPGEIAKTELAKDKPGGKPRDRGDKGSQEPTGMFYTDKQDRVVEVPLKNEEDAYRRGSQLYQKGQGDGALQEYLSYLAECKTCAHKEQAHYRAAELYVKQGRDGDALAHLEALLRASYADLRLKAYLLRADIDLRGGNVKRAIEGYSAAWNIDARNKDLPRKIADLYYDTKEYDSALPLYERSIESGNADDEVYFRAATICDGEGKTRNLEKAYGYYNALIERFKNSRHADYARKRVAFLKKNFYNFK